MVVLYDPFLQVIIKINDRVHKDNAQLLTQTSFKILCVSFVVIIISTRSH